MARRQSRFQSRRAARLKNAKTHVLEYALRGLGETQRRVLHTIAAFRMPATWDTLRAAARRAPLRTRGRRARGNDKEHETLRRPTTHSTRCSRNWKIAA